MEDLASQAAEVQAASKALDLREQQLSVSAKPTALCRLCRPVPLCSLVSRCPCLSVRVAQWVSASITLLLSRSVHVSKRCSERMLPHVSQSMCLLSHLPVYVSNVSQCAHARGQAAALASRVLPLHPLTAAPSFPCLPAACACRHMPRALVALDTLGFLTPDLTHATPVDMCTLLLRNVQASEARVQAKEKEVLQLGATLLTTPAHAAAPVGETYRWAHAYVPNSAAPSHVPNHVPSSAGARTGDADVAHRHGSILFDNHGSILQDIRDRDRAHRDSRDRGLERQHRGQRSLDFSASLSSLPVGHRLSRLAEAGEGAQGASMREGAQGASMLPPALSLSVIAMPHEHSHEPKLPPAPSLSGISQTTSATREGEEAARAHERTSLRPVSSTPQRRPSPGTPAASRSGTEQAATQGRSDSRRLRRPLEDEEGDVRDDFGADIRETRHDIVEDYSAGVGSRVMLSPEEHSDAHEDPLVKEHIREQLRHVEDRAAELEKRELQVLAQKRELEEQVQHHNSKFVEAEKRLQKRIQKLEKLNFRNQLKAAGYLSDSSANTSNTTNPAR
jgi:hypothetical protein